MQTIYHYRCEGCEEVHEDSSRIHKCHTCGCEICSDCSIPDEKGNKICEGYCEPSK